MAQHKTCGTCPLMGDHICHYCRNNQKTPSTADSARDRLDAKVPPMDRTIVLTSNKSQKEVIMAKLYDLKSCPHCGVEEEAHEEYREGKLFYVVASCPNNHYARVAYRLATIRR